MIILAAMWIRKNIPNLLTLFNLLAGVLAVVFTFNGLIYWAGWLVLAAAIFDVFDGAAARYLNVSSPIGGDLDSLADAISFGLAPSLILYKFMWLNEFKSANAYLPFDLFDRPIGYEIYLIPFISFWLVIAGVIRLARFNNDTRQATSFIGLPIPACGLFFAFIPIIFQEAIWNIGPVYDVILNTLSDNTSLAILVVLIPSMMLSPIPMFSLKVKSKYWKDYLPQILFLIVGIIIFIAGRFLVVPVLILLYIIYSLISLILRK
jgi:CDP-diacylglycerol--serine O-phosphatidyltransferase